MRTLYFIFMLCCLGLISQAQTKRLMGVVIDSLSQHPLPYATVQLTNANSQQATTTDINGNYVFKKLSAGQYDIALSYIGYQNKKTSVTINEVDPETLAPKIGLSLANVNLKEVKVKAMRPFIEQEIDKVVLNVAESIMANSGSSLDVLKRSPSVQVNENDGSITFKGKKVMIFLDGKMSVMTGESLEGVLSAMPSNSIDRIELISNPSAKYEASGMAVINIKTLKMRNLGTNGSWGAGANIGRYMGYNGNLLLNHKTQKLSILGNYSHQLNHQYSNIYSYRTILNKQYFGDNEALDTQRRLQFYKFMIDYDLSGNTTMGAIFQGDNNSRNRLVDAATVVGKNTTAIDSTILINTDSRSLFGNWNMNFNLRHQFKQKGQNISIDIDFGQYKSDWNEYFTQQFLKNTSNVSYKQPNEIWFPWSQNNAIQSLKLDYTQPLKSGVLDMGFQLRQTQMNMNFEFREKIETLWKTSITRSFDYNYSENVQAAYLNYSTKKDKLSYQTGLRYEQSQVAVTNFDNKSDNKQNYGYFFPSFSAQYNYDKIKVFNVSFTRRIARPSYGQLNERPIYFNPFRKTIGNAYLKPTIINSVETGFQYKQSWFFTLSYTLNQNDVSLIPTLVNNSTDYKSFNFKKSEIFSFDLSLNKAIKPWWNTNTGLQVFYTKNDFRNLSELSTTERQAFYFRSNNYFTLKNGVKIELLGLYLPRQELGAFTTLSLKKIDIGVQKSILQKRGDLRLQLTDLFNSYSLRYLFFTNQIVGDEEIKSETRLLKISFLYRFGNTFVKVKDRKMGIERENNRVEK